MVYTNLSNLYLSCYVDNRIIKSNGKLSCVKTEMKFMVHIDRDRLQLFHVMHANFIMQTSRTTEDVWITKICFSFCSTIYVTLST